MMATLGLFVFMLPTVAYQQLQVQKTWRHPTSNRVGRRPSTQFLGPDNDIITLSGVLMPGVTGGRLSMLALEAMAETGKAWPLLDGNGIIYGMFVIESINQNKSLFLNNGAARRIEFTIKLKRIDETLLDMLSDLGDQLIQLKDDAISYLDKVTA